jgi:glucose/arabinose dehydrogenase
MLVLSPSAIARGANVVPAGFEDTTVAKAASVTDIAFTPDGRMLTTTQPGILSVRRPDGTVLNGAALDLRTGVCSNLDRGFQSVAVDPSFAANRYIYIYYTSSKNGTCENNVNPNGPVNRVSRFVLADNNVVNALSETVLVDNIPSMHLHQGGDIEFGKDGNIYVSVGDGGCDYARSHGCFSANYAARDTNTLLGKILRLTTDGGIPADNPYTGENTARCNLTGGTDAGKFCQEIFASGLRNPWKLAFDPNAAETRFFINDVGQSSWEEIDLGQSGADYGWNVREGFCATDSVTDCGAAPAGMTDPIYAYVHLEGCKAITGGAFVPAAAWRPDDEGAYVFADFTCGKFFELALSPTGDFESRELLSGMGENTIVAVAFGPYGSGQALYYSSWATAEIRRLAFVGIDATAPATSITSGPSGVVTDPNANFGFTSSESPARFECKLDGPGSTSGAFASCDSPQAFSGLPEGDYTFSVRAKDQAGNTGDPATRAFSIDATAPSSTASSPPGAWSPALMVDYSATDGSGSGLKEVELWVKPPGADAYELAATDSTPAISSFEYTAGAGLGPYNFYTRARDLAGNYEDAPESAPDTTTVINSPAAIAAPVRPVAPVSPRVLLGSTRLKMTRRGLVRLTLGCQGSTYCKGTLVLSRGPELGSAWFSLARDRSSSLSVRLSRRGRRFVRKLKTVKVRVSLLVLGAARTSYTAKLSAL